MASPQVIQVDTLAGASGSSYSYSFFEYYYGGPAIGIYSDESLIFMIAVSNTNPDGVTLKSGNPDVSGITVTSVTDNLGNHYVQVPGARIAAAPGVDGYSYALDVWKADNIVGPVGENVLEVTWNLSESASSNIMVLDVRGVVGGAVSLFPQSGTAESTLAGPAMSASVESLFVAAFGVDTNNQSPTINSPWSFGAGIDYTDSPLNEVEGPCYAAYCVGTGGPAQPVTPLYTNGQPTSYVITGIVFGPESSGGGGNGGSGGGGNGGGSGQPTVQVVYFVEPLPQIVLDYLKSAPPGNPPTYAQFQEDMQALIAADQLPSSSYVLRTEYAQDYPAYPQTIGNQLTVGE
jgi:hypothetical protein